jgi:hypothetical protein
MNVKNFLPTIALFLSLQKRAWNNAGEMSIGKIIGIIVVVIVAMALLPTLITSVNTGYWATNGTTYSSAHALIPLIVLFFVLAVIVAAVMWVVHETKGQF